MTSTSVSRPGGITALGVLTIVLGLLGLLKCIMTIGGLVLQGQMQSVLAALPVGAEAERVGEMVEEAEAEMRQHVARNWIGAVVRLCVATALLLGGIWSLGLKPIGRTTLMAAFGVGILFELFQLWPQWEARELSTKAFERMMQAQQQGRPNPPPGGDAIVKTTAQIMAATQMMMIAAMFLAKSGFYGFGLWYLTRTRVANLFVRPQPADLPLA